ncbi:MAG: hypothetical protein V2B18_01040 [Pseudomonadota bacterium]
MGKCKSCGRDYNPVQAMTYSAYGYCSWDCLMKSRNGNQGQTNNNNNGNRSNRKNHGNRAGSTNYRSRWG